MASDTTLCNVACAPGLSLTGASDRGVRARRGSLVYGGQAAAPSGALARGSVQQVLVLGQQVVVWVANDVELWGRRVGDNDTAAERFDTSAMLMNTDRTGDDLMQVRIVSHDALDQASTGVIQLSASYQGLWLLFVFRTRYCEGVTTERLMPCTSIERFIILRPDQLPSPMPANKYAQIYSEDTGALCAVYPVSTFGGATFVHGDARWEQILAAASLTMGTIGFITKEMVFWSALTAGGGQPVLVQYNCVFYATPLPGNNN